MGSRRVRVRGLYRLMRAKPESITYRIPGMVREVSAIFVAITILPRRGREHSLLLAGAEPAKQRNDIHRLTKMGLEQIVRFADVALSRHEHQDIAGAGFHGDLFGRPHRCVNVGQFSGLFAIRIEWRINNFDGIKPSGNFDDRRAVKRFGECLGVNRGRRDDQLQFRSLRQKALQVPE